MFKMYLLSPQSLLNRWNTKYNIFFYFLFHPMLPQKIKTKRTKTLWIYDYNEKTNSCYYPINYVNISDLQKNSKIFQHHISSINYIKNISHHISINIIIWALMKVLPTNICLWIMQIFLPVWNKNFNSSN
jgi:hypothetical protein